MQAELEKQFSVLAAQLEGPVSEFEDTEREAQVLPNLAAQASTVPLFSDRAA